MLYSYKILLFKNGLYLNINSIQIIIVSNLNVKIISSLFSFELQLIFSYNIEFLLTIF